MLREHIFYSRFYVVCGELCREPEVKLNLQLPRDDIGDTGASMNIGNLEGSGREDFVTIVLKLAR